MIGRFSVHATIQLITGILFYLVSGYVCAQQSLVQVKLKSNVYVTGPIVHFGDIATFETANKTLQQELAALEISKSPRIGYADVISQKDLRHFLLRNHPQLHSLIGWNEGDKVQVRAHGRVVAYDGIAAQAGEFIRQQIDNEHRKVSISTNNRTETINLPHGELTFIPRMNTTYISKKMCIWMDAYIDGVFYRSVPVWVNVEIIEKVYQAKYNIEDRNTVIPEDFTLVERDVTDFSARHVIAGKFDQPLLINQGMAQGDVLLSDNVKPIPAVIGGRKVNIRVIEGGVRLQIQGIALRDAEIGEHLKIKPIHSDQLIKVKVIGKQLVEVI